MKKLLLVASMAALLAGCATDPYQKRIDAERERNEKVAERALDKAPKWLTELPKSTNAVYAAGTATSTDLNMADEKAKLMALGSICMSAGGEVDQQGRVFRTDSSRTSNESSDSTTRSMCKSVDMTGAEITEIKRVTEDGIFRSYVLVALPMGEANILKKTKMEAELARINAARAGVAMQDLDAKTGRPSLQ